MTETAFEDLSPPELVAQDDLTPPSEAPKAKAKRAKKEKVPKAEKEAKPEAGAQTRKSKLSALYPEDAEITLLVEGNPKKQGSRAHAVFEFYKDSKTVGDFFAASAGVTIKNKDGEERVYGGDYGDITYDVGHGYIKVG